LLRNVPAQSVVRAERITKADDENANHVLGASHRRLCSPCECALANLLAPHRIIQALLLE
jgi:hypothetical protein